MSVCVPTDSVVDVVGVTAVNDEPSDTKQDDQVDQVVQDDGPNLDKLDTTTLMAMCRKDPRVLLNKQLAFNMYDLLVQLREELYGSPELVTPVFCQVVTQLMLRACPEISQKISLRDYHYVEFLANYCVKYAFGSMKSCFAEHQTQLLRGADHYGIDAIKTLVNKVVSA